MFYRLIGNKRDEWLNSDDCTVRNLLDYIQQRGFLRDAQLEAVKTYLYLKIACHNKPLWQLFTDGAFNSLDISKLELSVEARDILTTNKAAAALLEYARLTDKNGSQLAPELESFIKRHTSEIDYADAFKKIFYGVEYTDYLFSLPMGAGKTYLMAAFIYLDLYFALNEPDNPSFAHNFIILAPSGLKSSIIPSLKHIQEFDPAWIIPEPTASQLKRLVKFEILDEQKTANKSNRVKNPNAQKINIHQPLEDLIGLVAITNAEKVILDRFDDDNDSSLLSKEEKKQLEVANELREIIGSIPSLAIYIDEVHHAADGEIKLRKVVNQWTLKHTFNSVLGFSGTPYLDTAERVTLAGQFSIRNTDLANVVFYYPLMDGISNFLKNPTVKYADADPNEIVSNGVKEFLDNYKDLVYANGTCAKLAIYCGRIDTLEENIYPLVAQIVSSYGLNPSEIILKYHEGNKQFPKPEGSGASFSSLDTSMSKIKIVLLVQIGKEGWDCKSLTGVILPQKGVCPTNMVLQTSCRCLRQVNDKAETALIWMNKFNADTLNRQLRQQQNITLQEFGSKMAKDADMIERFSRMDYLKVPPIDFYQLKVSYETLIIDQANNPAARLEDERTLAVSSGTLVHQQNMAGEELKVDEYVSQENRPISFRWWLHTISKESFGSLSIEKLMSCEKQLLGIFNRITQKDGDMTVEDDRYDHKQIRSLIRQAFLPVRDYKEKEEILPCQASLLQIGKLTSPVADSTDFYPSQNDVKEIVDWDSNPKDKELTKEQMGLIEQLRVQGLDVSGILPKKDPHPERIRTYHYLPYRFDSAFERSFLKEILPIISDRNLEVYFNGDDSLTEFRIRCFKRSGNHWSYIGYYFPDFLLIRRNADGEIHQIAIIETKGEGFASKFADKRRFMETEFVRKNNDKFGYRRFDFLYLEDTWSKEQRQQKILHTICNFFTE